MPCQPIKNLKFRGCCAPGNQPQANISQSPSEAITGTRWVRQGRGRALSLLPACPEAPLPLGKATAFPTPQGEDGSSAVPALQALFWRIKKFLFRKALKQDHNLKDAPKLPGAVGFRHRWMLQPGGRALPRGSWGQQGGGRGWVRGVLCAPAPAGLQRVAEGAVPPCGSSFTSRT